MKSLILILAGIIIYVLYKQNKLNDIVNSVTGKVVSGINDSTIEQRRIDVASRTTVQEKFGIGFKPYFNGDISRYPDFRFPVYAL